MRLNDVPATMVALDDKDVIKGVRRLADMLVESTTWFDGKPHLTPDQEDALQWAKEFMDKYERKHKK